MEARLGASLRRYERCSGSSGMISTLVVFAALLNDPVVSPRPPRRKRYYIHRQGYPQPFQFSTINRRYRLYGINSLISPAECLQVPASCCLNHHLEFVLIHGIACFFEIDLGSHGIEDRGREKTR